MGPRMLPCGTPHVKDRRSDDFPETLTYCVRPRRNDSSHDKQTMRTAHTDSMQIEAVDTQVQTMQCVCSLISASANPHQLFF